MITGAIFDVDGTLLDSMPIWDNAAAMYLKHLGIEAEQNLGKLLYPMSMTQGSEYLKNKYHMELDTEEIRNGVNHTIQEFYENQVLLKKGVKQFLTGMKRRNIRMTIATSSDRVLIEKAFQRLNILTFFERIYTCTEVSAGKEKPDIYFAAQQYMKTEITNTWVFEDAPHAIWTAKQAGFKTVGIFDESSADKQEEIKRSSDIYLSEFYDLETFLKKASL